MTSKPKVNLRITQPPSSSFNKTPKFIQKAKYTPKTAGLRAKPQEYTTTSSSFKNLPNYNSKVPTVTVSVAEPTSTHKGIPVRRIFQQFNNEQSLNSARSIQSNGSVRTTVRNQANQSSAAKKKVSEGVTSPLSKT